MIDKEAIDIKAKTLYGEARGEGEEGLIAVGNVIKNRVKKKTWYGKTVKDVCLKAWQFSCWNHNDPNFKTISSLDKRNKTFAKILVLAEQILNDEFEDNTEGSTHYHTSSIKPKWAKGLTPVVTLGNHLFYNNVR